MKLQLIRNAAMRLTYGGRTFLTDPMLSPAGQIRSFAGKAKNPTVELPLEIDEVVAGLDGVVVSHGHPDHLDEPALAALPKGLPVFCQPDVEKTLVEAGFENVIPIESAYDWQGITLSRTGGKHGSGKILEGIGQVSGFVFQAQGEPIVYWAGDTIWCPEAAEAIETFKPRIIITHSGGATLPGFEPIIMDAPGTLAALRAGLKAEPEAVVVAIHLEALDHCETSRDELRSLAEKEGVSSAKLFIPADGETLEF